MWGAFAFIVVALLNCAVTLPALAQAPAQALAQAPAYPALTGRVVDAANVLKPADRDALAAKLKAQEDKTSDQVVVATVPSLGGEEIEPYANGLFRHWQLGGKDKNNGVLILVAPNQHRVRIEVGYGLEGALTDALSSVIIRTAMTPKFKTGDYAGGLNAGVDAVLSILAGDADEWQRKAQVKPAQQTLGLGQILPGLFMVVLFFLILRAVSRAQGGGTRYHRTRGGAWVPMPIPGPGWGGGWGGGGGGFGGGGGGFSGGGGSSGGGGASGSW